MEAIGFANYPQRIGRGKTKIRVGAIILYVILPKTVFPEYWELLAHCHIQKAEYDLRLGRHYGQRATKLKDTLRNKVLLYPWDDANRIVEYWKKRRERTQYKVLGYTGTI